MDEIKLFRKNANSLGSWRIWSEGDMIHIAHATVLGGSEVRHQEKVETNLSGRTLQEQVALRIRSRVSRMMDKGYKESVELAQRDSSNQLGLERPMLAHPIERVANVDKRGAVLQKKLDGHRCLITRNDGELLAYSRQGKRIPAIRHLLEPLEDRIDEGRTIDGELYCHGVPLQTIGSWIKREQAATAQLYFVAYDLISRDVYRERHRELSEIVRGVDTGAPGKVVALPFHDYIDEAHTSHLFRQVRSTGFEGLMLRLDRRGYEAGKRSSSLLKIKEFEDAEFKVIGFKQASTGWAICVCITEDGKTFDCSAPGDLAAKQYVWDNQDKFLNRYMTIDFAHWTNDGLPFQPTATRWHDPI